MSGESLAHAGHKVWDEIAPEIKASEFRRPFNMSVEALRRLSRIRRACGVPFRFVSDSRSESQGVGVANSAHNEVPCTAVDLRVHNGAERFLLVREALAQGCVRIGVYPPTVEQEKLWGKTSGSVHLDFSKKLIQGVMWPKF